MSLASTPVQDAQKTRTEWMHPSFPESLSLWHGEWCPSSRNIEVAHASVNKGLALGECLSSHGLTGCQQFRTRKSTSNPIAITMMKYVMLLIVMPQNCIVPVDQA